MLMIFTDLRRLYLIIKIILSYGIDKIIPQTRLTLPLLFILKILFWIKNKHSNKHLGDRLRLALQELGPIWIKLGQMLSTRIDLFPHNITEQLSLLQDSVKPFDGSIAREYIERSLGKPLETWLNNFQQKPLASASIAQVHTALLKKNGKEVVIKVIRPDILPIIQTDIRLMYRLANWISRLYSDSKRLRIAEIVFEYEKILMNELNLLREAANTIQLRRNFTDSNLLYIPEVYSDYCTEKMMVMERIYGLPISDIKQLKNHGINLKLLAERGVQIFFTQVFRDNFFHGDMHPGNIFVSDKYPENPQYIAIDCGIVGSLNKEDKRYLAENLLAFFNRDYRKVAELHVDSGWVPQDTKVEEFEYAIRTVCEPIFEKPLIEISFGHILLNLFNTARTFNMEVQPQLILLQKTLLYIEGIGRQLYPQLDLWQTAKPFLEKWITDQMSITAFLRSLKKKTPFLLEKLPEFPELVFNSLQQYLILQKKIDFLILELKTKREKNYYANNILYSIVNILIVIGICIVLHNIENISIWLMIIVIVNLFLLWIWKRFNYLSN